MTLEFQEDLLKFIVQNNYNKDLIRFIDSEIFDLEEHKVVFSLIQDYLEDYNHYPSQNNFLQYLENKVKNVSDNTLENLRDIIKTSYKALNDDVEIYKEALSDFYIKKKTKLFVAENMSTIDSEDFSIDKWAREFKKLEDFNQIKDSQKEDSGSFLFKDFTEIVEEDKDVTPTYLKSLNAMTADGGFFSPQLICLMSGPKGFKTGTMINIVKHFVMDGKRVFYADFENSYKSINSRVFQSMLGCRKHELHLPENKRILQKQIDGFKMRGGDLRTEYFPAHISNLNHVDNRLEELKELYNWTPEIIIYDYLDLAGCADRTIKEKRLQIQYNYHHAIRLNNKWGMFAMTLSQISKAAQEKMEKTRYIDIKDFSEDFGKAMNCHAAFAMCRDKDDLENNCGVIIPVAQREGVRYMDGIECRVGIHEATQTMEEDESYLPLLLEKIRRC